MPKSKSSKKNKVEIDGSYYINLKISKEFDNEIYQGTIDSHDHNRSLWHVTYNDGDEEELNYAEILLGIHLAKGNNATHYVGKQILRSFGSEVYHGTVDKYDEKDRLWHVTFEDGDEEELDLEELLFALDSYNIVKRAEEKKKDEIAATNNNSAVKSAPPPMHTVIVFTIVMSMCMYMLPSLQSIDKYATNETFTSTIFKNGPFALPPIALAIIRLSFAFTCLYTTMAKIKTGSQFKIVKLPGSKLNGGMIYIRGWRTQGFYTSWGWNLLGISFFLGGVIPLLVVIGREDVLHANPWILRSALIGFEIAAPSALLTSFIVTYALWPKAYVDHGESGTTGFRGWIGLMQHDANAAFVLAEVCLMGGLPVKLSHAAFAPLFAGVYQVFLWCMMNVWDKETGPFFPYFFMDTTLGWKTTAFLVILLSAIGFFFILFAMLDKFMLMIEHSGHGSLPNVICVYILSYLLMRFKDPVKKEKKEVVSTSNDNKLDYEESNKSSKTVKKNHTKSFTIPAVIVGVVAIIFWMCTQVTAVKQETILRSTGLLKFQPDKYQGAKRNKRYFEGWYYKFVSSLDTDDEKEVMSMAVVPGIFYGNTSDSSESHAFIFVTVNGERQHYYRFDTSEFEYANGKEDYYIQLADNRFTHSGVSLNLQPRENDDASLTLTGNLTFTYFSPWPVSLTKLGAMGPVGWISRLECTHGLLSFDHVLHGSLTLSSTSSVDEQIPNESPVVTFDNGRGYTEKDFGRSFPSLWIWLQTNSFRNNPGTSLFVSVARLPLFGQEFPGFTAALWHNSQLIPFTTWSGAKFEDIRVSEDEVYIVMKSSKRRPSYRLELTVDRRNVPEVLLYAPVNFTSMQPFVNEALQAKVHMRLFNSKGDLLLDDIGDYAGLEVHGNVQWLVDNVCGKKTANKFICL